MVKLKSQLKDASTIVVKVGTTSVTHENTSKINLNKIEKMARVLTDLKNEGKNIVLVSSGAIGVGVGKMNLKKRPTETKYKQAVAAVGQCTLMSIYSRFFGEYGQQVAQILLTSDIMEKKEGVENVKNTFEALFDMDVIPIVNENDSVSIAEIDAGKESVFNENDTLSAIVAKLVEADVLFILSDIDGFYDSDPKKNPDSHKIPYIDGLTEEMKGFAEGVSSKLGTGGMVTKLKAAKIANESGTHMVLASGEDPAVIKEILDGAEEGSIFISKKKMKKED